MSELYLTAYDGTFLGPVAKLLGMIMDKIYVFISNVFNIESIPLTIVIFTIFIYLCLFPLTYKQQKYSMLTRKMQPEISEIQKKYKNKKDQASIAAMNEETQAIYDKYGISPMGSCVQALIQMPILLSLYRVFYNVPAYISNVKNVFTNLVNDIMATENYRSLMKEVYTNANIKNVRVDFSTKDATEMSNYLIDVLYKLSESGWKELSDAFPSLTDSITDVTSKLSEINYLFLLNISDTPYNIIKTGFASHQWLLVLCAILIPVLSYLTQVLNIKLMPTANTNGNDQMAQQMKMMNRMMPLMSLVLCFTVPVGLGFYWIIGAVVRFVQQFFLNKHFEKINLDDIIEANKEKAKKKQEKRGIRQAQIYEAARTNTKNSMLSKATISSNQTDALNRAAEARQNAKAGSLSSKANLVKDFNERNNK